MVRWLGLVCSPFAVGGVSPRGPTTTGREDMPLGDCRATLPKKIISVFLSFFPSLLLFFRFVFHVLKGSRNRAESTLCQVASTDVFVCIQRVFTHVHAVST